jgi:hypothetical protein
MVGKRDIGHRGRQKERVFSLFPVFLRKSTLPTMRTHTHPSRFLSVVFGVFLGLALVPVARAQTATPAPAGPIKVRVLVQENMGGTAPSGSSAATPAPIRPAAAAGQTPAPAAAKAAIAAADMKTYTRTSNKSFTITVVNITPASMDVIVKTNVLAKDEAGKHEVLTEKVLENKLTILPGKPNTFTTEDVTFTHTTAHRGPSPKAGGGGGGGGGGKKGGPIAPMEPASGHAYFGYKVEVFQGNDLVGSAASETH